MKQGFVKVASATPRIRVADPVYNAQVICEQAKEAAEHGAKIVVFPELCITGYTCNDLFLQELLLEKAKEALLTIAEETGQLETLFLVGLPVVLHNTVFQKLCSQGCIPFQGSKIHRIQAQFITHFNYSTICHPFNSTLQRCYQRTVRDSHFHCKLTYTAVLT